MIFYHIFVSLTVEILMFFIKYALVSDIGKQFVDIILSLFG